MLVLFTLIQKKKNTMSDTKIAKHPILERKDISFIVISLCIFGIIMILSASRKITNESDFYMIRQAINFIVGLVFMFLAASFPYRLYRSFAYIVLFISLCLLVAIYIPSLGVESNGSTRWLSIGGFRFQPSEIAKLSLIIFFGYSLSKKQSQIKGFLPGFLFHVFVLLLFAGLIIKQPDLGTVIVLNFIAICMMFVARVRWTHLSFFLPAAGIVFYFLVYNVKYRWDRVLAFFNPDAYLKNHSYQLIQSLKAFGSGGVLGEGVGRGTRQMNFLPEPHTDFIFSIIGEELGLIGVCVLLCLYLYLIIAGMNIAKNCNSKDSTFGAILATGIVAYVAVHVLINAGAALVLIPTKGLTLPFVSYGGTSLVINMIAMGILINIGASNLNEQKT